MRTALAACLVALIIPTPSPVAAVARTSEIMESYLWNKRPLLVFAPELENSVVQDQRAALAEAMPAFLDRDMVHLEVLGDTVWINRTTSELANADQLRRKYGVAQAETVILLIGKDGGLKLRRHAAIDPHDLYNLIDTMPMRQRKMRNGGSSL